MTGKMPRKRRQRLDGLPFTDAATKGCWLPTRVMQRCSVVSESLPALGILTAFYDSPDDRCVVILVSICISLTANDAEN